MTGVYLAGLLVSIAGLVALDFRMRLFLFAAPLHAAVVLVVGVAGFLAWDAAGVGLGVFFEGRSGLLVGVDLARDIPLEELFFLILLCLTAMDAFLLAQRLLAGRTAGSATDDGPRRRGGAAAAREVRRPVGRRRR